MGKALIIDGSRGEGGGQILRTSLSLASILRRPCRLEHIRVGRARPGLAAQHLTCVRALSEVASAEVKGDQIGSMELDFRPGRVARSGRYNFNVADARKGGSAGAASLILQSVLMPLALVSGKSEVTLLGGTHVPWSPPFDFLSQTFLPLLTSLGIETELDLRRPGFYPIGGGRILARIIGAKSISPLRLEYPGNLHAVRGRITLASLSLDIAERMTCAVKDALAPLGVDIEIEVVTPKARSTGVALFLSADYDKGQAGFSAIGEKGKSSEAVAHEACDALLNHHKSGSAVDLRLADQLLLPLSFASGKSVFTTSRATNHLHTNAQTIEQFGVAKITVEDGNPVRVSVSPT